MAPEDRERSENLDIYFITAQVADKIKPDNSQIIDKVRNNSADSQHIKSFN